MSALTIDQSHQDRILELAAELAEASTPEAVLDDPDRRLTIYRTLASFSPAGLALVTGRGKWKMAHHHMVLDQAITECVNADEGRLLISVSVRAGKSVLGARYTPAWYLGTHPDMRVMLGAHEGGFASEHSGFARDVLTEYGARLYGVTVDRTSSARKRWDLEGHAGGMIAVGAGGSPIGRGGDLMIIDDPIKNFEQAMSDKQRHKVNETWFQGTMVSRIEAGGSVIVICSRWHEDDLSGWLMSNWPGEWKEIHIPALCDNPAEDILGRQMGDSFWPERWPKARLLRIKDRVGPIVWNGQFQQRPTAPEGTTFKVGKLVYKKAADVDWSSIDQWGIGWDLAATEDDGDYTVGLLLGRYNDGRWIVAGMTRGQWSDANVRQNMRRVIAEWKALHGDAIKVKLPQDPGSAGKGQAKQLGAMLSGSIVSAEPQTGSKETRASGLGVQVELENVDVVSDAVDPIANAAGLHEPWLRALVEEWRAFPNGEHDDIVDAAAIIFNEMVLTVFVDDPIDDDMYDGMTRYD